MSSTVVSWYFRGQTKTYLADTPEERDNAAVALIQYALEQGELHKPVDPRTQERLLWDTELVDMADELYSQLPEAFQKLVDRERRKKSRYIERYELKKFKQEAVLRLARLEPVFAQPKVGELVPLSPFFVACEADLPIHVEEVEDDWNLDPAPSFQLRVPSDKPGFIFLDREDFAVQPA